MSLTQPGVTLLRLLLDALPQRLQLRQPLPDGRRRRRLVGAQQVVTALEDVVIARLVALDLLLQGLRKGWVGGRWSEPGHMTNRGVGRGVGGRMLRGGALLTWFFLMSSCTVCRLWPWSVEVARGSRSSTHS